MKQNIKVKISLYISIIGLLFLVVGSSFALLQDTKTSTKNQIIQTGSVKLKLTEDAEGITLSNLQSLTDAEGFLQETYYDFSIKNTGDTTAEISVLLIDDPNKTNELDDSFIRVGLEVNGEKADVMNLEDVERVINERVIKKHETVKYRLRLWVDYDKYNSSDIFILENTTIGLKIKVDAIQYVGEGGITVFNYTGDYQEFVVPNTGYYQIEAYGAQGSRLMELSAALGGYSSGKILLNEGEKLYIYVGENTTTATTAFNGGGTSYTIAAGVGGGATDIRYFGDYEPTEEELVWNSTLGLNSRIMVAGGGGTANGNNVIGHGGGLIGGTSYNPNYPSNTATGGTQTSGGVVTNYSSDYTAGTNGSFGMGGSGGGSSTYGSGSGGGGYYGGAGGSRLVNGSFPSGGGSSFISGYAGVNAITSSTDRTHTNNTMHYSEKYFIDGKMLSGVNSGNGSVSITYIGKELERTNTKLNNVRYIKDCMKQNNVNTYNIWVDFQAIYKGENVAKGIVGTLYDSAGTSITQYNSTTRAFSLITDGDITTANYSYGSTYSGLQCFVIDLGSTYDLDEIGVWHYWGDNRLNYENVTYVSSDNSTWTEVINKQVPETSEGKHVTAWDKEIDDTNLMEQYTTDNLVFWFDGKNNTSSGYSSSTTSWYDLSGNGNNGTTYSSPAWKLSGLSFSGSVGVTVADLPLTSYTGITLEGYVQADTISGTDSIIANTNSGGAEIELADGKPQFGIYLGGAYAYVPGPSVIDISKPHLITGTYKNGIIKVYLDGELVVTTTNTGTFTDSNNSTVMTVGCNPSGSACESGYYFDGIIYSARLYSDALTDNQIMNHYLIEKQRFGG